jgi:thiol-disulfide isomerase/thioredoxin
MNGESQMPNHRRRRTSIALLVILCQTASHADEPKSYPVISGVGIALKTEGGNLRVGVLLPESPAGKCGKIQEGDCIASVEVDGKQTSLKGKTVGEAASLIRGPVGTELTLTVFRPKDDATFPVKLKRAALELEGVEASAYDSFIGKPVADLRLSSLDGDSQERLADYRGKVVVVDFWASWCETCYQPVAKLQTIAAKHPEWAGQVELITVTVDADRSIAAATIRKQKWNKTLNLAVDLDDLKAIGVSVVPVAVIISRDGTVVNMAGSHALDFEKEITSQLTP